MIELATAHDLSRLRLARAVAETCGERRRVRCARCAHAIPPEKRRDAKYCSPACKRRAGPERRYALLREIRQAVRASRAVTHCACGTALDISFRRGPVPTRCPRCYFREAMRCWRATHKARQS